jgi:hypothetical protein
MSSLFRSKSSASESCWASLIGFYYSLIVFLLGFAFFDRRACIFAFKFAFEAPAAGFAAGAPTTGFFTGDFCVCGLAGAALAATGLAGAALATGLPG